MSERERLAGIIRAEVSGKWSIYSIADALLSDPAFARAGELAAENERLRAVLRDVLALGGEKASNKGDCCCMFWNRTREREYETGTCPHQRARAALNTIRND